MHSSSEILNKPGQSHIYKGLLVGIYASGIIPRIPQEFTQ